MADLFFISTHSPNFMKQDQLAIISVSIEMVNIATINEWLSIIAVVISITAGVLSIIKHFKKK